MVRIGTIYLSYIFTQGVHDAALTTTHCSASYFEVMDIGLMYIVWTMEYGATIIHYWVVQLLQLSYKILYLFFTGLNKVRYRLNKM